MIEVLLSRVNASRVERGEAVLADANALRHALLEKAVDEMRAQIESELAQIAAIYLRLDADGQARVRRACGLPD